MKDIFIPMVYPTPTISKKAFPLKVFASEDSKFEHIFLFFKKSIIGAGKSQTYSHHALLPLIS
jgi:hypothetical protein